MKIIKSIHFKPSNSSGNITLPLKWVLVLPFLCKIIGVSKPPPKDPIDTAHLRDYPYCGSMYYQPRAHDNKASGRSVNTKDSRNYYRWLAYLTQRNWQSDGSGEWEEQTCTGAIITDR